MLRLMELRGAIGSRQILIKSRENKKLRRSEVSRRPLGWWVRTQISGSLPSLATSSANRLAVAWVAWGLSKRVQDTKVWKCLVMDPGASGRDETAGKGREGREGRERSDPEITESLGGTSTNLVSMSLPIRARGRGTADPRNFCRGRDRGRGMGRGRAAQQGRGRAKSA
jgi:hypothetical protein